MRRGGVCFMNGLHRKFHFGIQKFGFRNQWKKGNEENDEITKM